MTLTPGTRLGHYQIDAPIGAGGMGQVYAALDTTLGRRVALKVLPADMAGGPDRLARFEREAKAVAALNHPHIVTIHSVEHIDGVHFITMELVEGRTLADLIPSAGLPLTTLLPVAIQTAGALSVAHRAGITHRDIKPANVMVLPDGRVKVLDFGLAKLTADDASDAARSLTALAPAHATGEGRILGTVAYMSPEQAEGKPVDARSDVFSMGIVLYEMATGRRPFGGDTPISTITSILRDTPAPISAINQSLPRHLGRIVKRALAKDPERRHQSALDLKNELEGLKEEIESGEIVLPESPSAPIVARMTWQSRSAVAAIAVVVIIGAAYGLYGWLDRAPDSGAAGTPAAMSVSSLGLPGRLQDPAISPDGRYFAYVRDDGGRNSSLWLSQIDGASSLALVPSGPASLHSPIFSPRGDVIYFMKSEIGQPAALLSVSALGGAVRTIGTDVEWGFSPSPDGTEFAFIRRGPPRPDNSGSTRNVLVAKIDGGEPRTIAANSNSSWVAWSPDGSVIAIDMASGTPQAEIAFVSVRGGAIRKVPVLARGAGYVRHAAWLPDGRGLVITFDEGRGLRQLWGLSYPSGELKRLTNDTHAYRTVSIAGDGTLLSEVTQSEMSLWWATVQKDAKPVELPIANKTDIIDASWSVDGRVLFTQASSRGSQIWSTHTARTELRQLTFGPRDTWISSAIASPDGRVIVFSHHTADNKGGLYRMDRDGGAPVQISSDADARPLLFHPDGRSIFFRSKDQLYSLSLADGTSRQVFDRTLRGSDVVSPDGTRVAVLAKRVGETGDYAVVPIDGRGPVVAINAIPRFRGLVWSPDSKALTYFLARDGATGLWSRPIVGGPARELARFEGEDILSYSLNWSPDGSRIAFFRSRDSSDLVLIRNYR